MRHHTQVGRRGPPRQVAKASVLCSTHQGCPLQSWLSKLCQQVNCSRTWWMAQQESSSGPVDGIDCTATASPPLPWTVVHLGSGTFSDLQMLVKGGRVEKTRDTPTQSLCSETGRKKIDDILTVVLMGGRSLSDPSLKGKAVAKHCAVAATKSSRLMSAHHPKLIELSGCHCGWPLGYLVGWVLRTAEIVTFPTGSGG